MDSQSSNPLLDLALVNSWRSYNNDCVANDFPRNKKMPLLDFRMDIADTLFCTPDHPRRVEGDDDSVPVPRREYKIYRPANAPSAAKRYDGYEHYPISDDIKAPQTCRMENCESRSKIKSAYRGRVSNECRRPPRRRAVRAPTQSGARCLTGVAIHTWQTGVLPDVMRDMHHARVPLEAFVRSSCRGKITVFM
ncbi:hypothetical protein EVAR_55129_1 [Eumeta japonica]|uniref:Uncharacterized protein n=1 Tax=Eumeta variegata TaxID=151549 RepID=A0A4C1Y7X9_EUMVA|nr:hypothetical protein EVAR_55129_1 [Eumeta japonica]